MPYERQLGRITGPIILRDERGLHDLRASVWSGPGDGSADAVSLVDHDARFILLIEKELAFARLQTDSFAAKSKCVMICGNGYYPVRALHTLIRRLYDQLHLPFYVLADNDPAGYEFFFLMARGTGSAAGSERAELAIPSAAYLGLCVADYDWLGLSKTLQIQLTEGEREHLRRLKSRPWLESEVVWQRELDAFLSRGFKVETEALCTVSESCLAEMYLPQRLIAGAHLRLSAPGGREA